MTNQDIIKAYLASNPSNSGMCSLCCELYTETNPSVEYTLCHEIICRKCYFAFKQPKKCMVCGKEGGKYDLKSTSFKYVQAMIKSGKIMTLNIQTENGKTFQITIINEAKFSELVKILSQRIEDRLMKTLIKNSKTYNVNQQLKKNRTMAEMGFNDQDRIKLSSQFTGGYK